jgi:predicted transcriptional regulator
MVEDTLHATLETLKHCQSVMDHNYDMLSEKHMYLSFVQSNGRQDSNTGLCFRKELLNYGFHLSTLLT